MTSAMEAYVSYALSRVSGLTGNERADGSCACLFGGSEAQVDQSLSVVGWLHLDCNIFRRSKRMWWYTIALYTTTTSPEKWPTTRITRCDLNGSETESEYHVINLKLASFVYHVRSGSHKVQHLASNWTYGFIAKVVSGKVNVFWSYSTTLFPQTL